MRTKDEAIMSVRSRIFVAMQQIAEEQKVTLPPLDDELTLHETGFDSLAFAILVARLEDDLGIDPSPSAKAAGSPRPLGRFARPSRMFPPEIYALRNYLGPEPSGRVLS